MKTLLLIAAGAMGAIVLLGCTAHETTTTTSTPSNAAGRTYSNSTLKKTGQPDTAGAIEAADPDAQIR